MSEKKITIRFQGAAIDALLYEAPGNRAAVVTHPHPLYGGNMYNPVVTAIVDAYREMNYTTLRFNFRGIDQNPARYDQAEGGTADVRAALDYIQEMGKTEIDLAGYSFGSWINAIGIESFDAVSRLVLVSPPINFMDFSNLVPSDKIRLVITGSNDELAPYAKLEKVVPRWNPQATLRIIEGADHFYAGESEHVREAVREFLLNENKRGGLR